MFTLDVPYIPAQETPIVLTQADAASVPPQPDFILNDCQGTASAQEFDGTALRGIDPGYALANALNGAAGKPVVTDLSSIKNITLLESTKHGELVAGTSTSGRTAYRYDPIPDYVGEDRAVFMAEYNGKRYKIVVNLKVSNELDNELCPDNPFKLEKVTKSRRVGTPVPTRNPLHTSLDFPRLRQAITNTTANTINTGQSRQRT